MPDNLSANRAGGVQAVVLDWAGTAVDYGCMGPAAVFVDVFHHFGIRVTVAEARKFMGLEKKDHVRRMCGLPTRRGAMAGQIRPRTRRDRCGGAVSGNRTDDGRRHHPARRSHSGAAALCG
jgi:hypothetical protein